MPPQWGWEHALHPSPPLSAPEALVAVCAKPATSLGSFPHQEGRHAA